MTSNLETSTISAVTLALDAASLRHQAIAANIANAGSTSYQPVRVSFEEHLGAARAALRQNGALSAEDLTGLRPILEQLPATAGEAGSTVALDQQVAQLSENAVQYQALVKALNKQLSIIGTAINEGKR